VRFTPSLERVVRVLDTDETGALNAYTLAQASEIAPGNVAKILQRLEELGWVASQMTVTPHITNRPRRCWTLTEIGRREAKWAGIIQA
jgi:DNA-binding PadR family transcriptional regulator